MVNIQPFLNSDGKTLNVFFNGVTYFYKADSPIATVFYKYSTREVQDLKNLGILDKITEATPNLESLVQVSPNFPKVSLDEAIKLVNFYADYALNPEVATSTEVGSIIVMSDDGLQTTFLVPDQIVSGSNVSWENLLQDKTKRVATLNGDFTTFGRAMYCNLFAGKCHSHNTLTLATPSQPDNISELGTLSEPKPLSFNLLLSNFSYSFANSELSCAITPSIGFRGSRLFLDPKQVFSPLLWPYIKKKEDGHWYFVIPETLRQFHKYDPVIHDLVHMRKDILEQPSGLDFLSDSDIIFNHAQEEFTRSIRRLLNLGTSPEQIKELAQQIIDDQLLQTIDSN